MAPRVTDAFGDRTTVAVSSGAKDDSDRSCCEGVVAWVTVAAVGGRGRERRGS